VPSLAVLLGESSRCRCAVPRRVETGGPEHFRYLRSVTPIAPPGHPRMVTAGNLNGHRGSGTPDGLRRPDLKCYRKENMPRESVLAPETQSFNPRTAQPTEPPCSHRRLFRRKNLTRRHPPPP